MAVEQSIPVSEAVKRISGSQRGTFSMGGAAMRKQGIIPLNSGDPDFPTPQYIIDAAYQAASTGFTHYSPSQGDVELREALAEMVNEDHGQNYTGADVLVTHGGTGAIFAAVTGVLNPGDQAILFNPCFSLYDDCIKMANAETVWVPFRRDNYHLDPEALEAAITPRTKMIILNSPCNPTAIVLGREELQELERIVVRHNLVVLSDEIYDHLVWDGRTFVSTLDLPELAERTLLLNGFSKTFAMTGWRLGYLIGKNQKLIQAAHSVQRTMHGAVASPTQRAAIVALAGRDKEWLPEMQAHYDRRRRAGHAAIMKSPRFTCALPEAAFYFWIKVDTSMSSADMVKYFFDHKVAVRSGSEFGSEGEGHIRLTFAASDDEILEGIDRLCRAAEGLPR